jgi:hypothetical protein
MHLARRAFKAFTHLALDLTLFVRVEGFLESGQFLVSWPCGVEPELVRPDIRSLDPRGVWGLPSPLGYSGFTQIKPG